MRADVRIVKLLVEGIIGTKDIFREVVFPSLSGLIRLFRFGRRRAEKRPPSFSGINWVYVRYDV